MTEEEKAFSEALRKFRRSDAVDYSTITCSCGASVSWYDFRYEGMRLFVLKHAEHNVPESKPS